MLAEKGRAKRAGNGRPSSMISGVAESRRTVLQQALLQAAETVQQWAVRSDLQVTSKENAADPVTQGDLASQEAIVAVIGQEYPDEAIISEEVPGSHDLVEDRHWSGWVLDPIDGTNNFSRGISYYSVSIAYIENGQPVLGGIINPNNQEMFIAERGSGATCNGTPITVSLASDFAPGVRVATSNIIAGQGTWFNLQRLQPLGDVWFDIQGSTVLQLAELAAGRVDFFCHAGLKPWDSAAAFLVVDEAGGKLVNLAGEPADWRRPELVAGNPALVDKFLAISDR